MNKKVLGIAIPYYKNTIQCEEAFKELMAKIDEQLTDDMILYIYEDGQASQWLLKYNERSNVIIKGATENKGVSHARNVMIDYLINKVKYILFLDSDDMIDDDYLLKMYEYCADNSHEIIESKLWINDAEPAYDPKVVRCGVAGNAIQTKIIGNIRFDEKLQIGEDTNFMQDVCDLSKYRKKYCPTSYYYRLGINQESLTMKHLRKEIGKERI